MNNDTNVFNPVDLELSRSTFHYTPTITGTTMAGRLILLSLGKSSWR